MTERERETALIVTHIAPLELVNFGLHHDGVVVDGREGDGVRVLSVFFLHEKNPNKNKTVSCKNFSCGSFSG